jgi:hypothetical protein
VLSVDSGVRVIDREIMNHEGHDFVPFAVKVVDRTHESYAAASSWRVLPYYGRFRGRIKSNL